MKRTLTFKTTLVSLCTILVGGLLTFSNSATAFSIRDAHEAGSVQSSTPSRHNDESRYVNNLISVFLRSDERPNAFRSDGVKPHVVLPDHAIDRNARGRSVEVITAPSIGGVPMPGSGAGVPDGVVVDVQAPQSQKRG